MKNTCLKTRLLEETELASSAEFFNNVHEDKKVEQMNKLGNYPKRLMLFMVFLLSALVSGCGGGGDGGGNNSGDTVAPTVTSTTPANSANSATVVPINRKISATFSEAMDSAAIKAPTTFTLKQDTTSVPGVVTYFGITATFTPTANLAPNTTYTATITTGAKDLAGNALASNYVWTFTTDVSTDTTAPAVSSTVPANAATLVAINKAISASFSEAMDPATINATTFTIKQDATPVSGNVTYVGTTATFTPAANLVANKTYTATITTGAKDLALVGNALASPYVWTFTTGATIDTTPPIVSSTIPSNAAPAVAIGGNVAATFSEAMDALTITNATMTLKQGTTSVSGTVTYVGTTATFNPTSNLAASTVYTATITTGVKDLAGNALAVAKTWSFTTGTTADTTPPTVSSTLPADSATGVAVNANITATFSEGMDTSTLTAATMTLKQGTTPVSGVVTSTSATTATFNPTIDLTPGLVYTAAVTTGVKDLAGNPLAVTKSWTFTPLAVVPNGPKPVDLGTAGNYVILAKTGVSTTGTTKVVGDIGLSPAAQTYVTGFSETLAGTFATAPPIVTGKIYAADMATPTPSNLTTAISNMETAFTDAAGRSLPNFTELGAGNISGLTLVPGLYKWGTGVLIASGVTLSGGANDVWIFQIAQDLTVSNAVIVTLSGGAQAKNVFWQVSGQAILGTTSNFKGIILSQTAIVLQNGAVMTGRALAQTAVTLDANAVTQPAQ